MAPDAPTASELTDRFAAVRRRTIELCAPLTAEDQLVQPMADASPSKWHLAHTTWFFETFVLGLAGDAVFDPAFGFLFNSYYEAAGPRVERAHRGMLSRPGLDRVHAYRAETDRRIGAALADGALDAGARDRLELGLHHEQQHQELILTDIKYVLGTQPTRPPYRIDERARIAGWGPYGLCPWGGAEPRGIDLARGASSVAPARWRAFDGGIVEIGAPPGGFAFDNERPRHRVLVSPFRLATRPITNAELLSFIADGGYRDPRLWLSDGWHLAQAERWTSPLYWDLRAGEHAVYALSGMRELDPAEPACHLSYYEADAVARWAGARLPTEFEWELAAAAAGGPPARGNFADDDRLHPIASAAEGIDQLFGDVWEWTSSSYAPYPGFRPLSGALGEYNGKFMSGQQVLRGGSCLTPRGHVRPSYRNFFPPAARWQMTGVRLATDV
jgi:ergothioneine biosynthesis protein EgtB